jgi:tRNA threonylcarbamoyladenosine biosynthesis protein TsaE
MEFIVNNIDETMNIGFQIGKLANSGDIICLIGDLGTGKTHITKGIAKGLGIDEHITSPTFTIVNEYEGRHKLYHFDVYRVNDPDEIEAIGFDEYIFGDAVSIIEWANYIEELIPKEHIKINIEKISNAEENFRKIIINYTGNRYDYIKEINI